MDDKKKATLSLLMLAPLVGEGFSGSTPALEFLNPITSILLMALYGVGALLIREYLVRKNKSGIFQWKALFFLGALYGITEEGYILWSFFNNTWPDLQAMAWYGRAFGVNWLWVVFLTEFHTWFSITSPIVIVHLVFPDLQNQTILTDKGFRIAWIVFIGQSFIWMLYVYGSYKYVPGPIEYLLFIIIGFIIFKLAQREINLYNQVEYYSKIKEKLESKENLKPATGKSIFISLLFTAIIFLSAYLLPKTNWHSIVGIIWMAFFGAMFLKSFFNGSEGAGPYLKQNVWGWIVGSQIWLLYFLSISDILSFAIFVIVDIVILFKVRPNSDDVYFGYSPAASV